MPLPWWVSWLTAAGTITTAYLTRRLYWQGYVIGILNQILWWWITIQTRQWGFIVINAFMLWNYWRGIVEWRRAEVGRLR